MSKSCLFVSLAAWEREKNNENKKNPKQTLKHHSLKPQLTTNANRSGQVKEENEKKSVGKKYKQTLRTRRRVRKRKINK